MSNVNGGPHTNPEGASPTDERYKCPHAPNVPEYKKPQTEDERAQLRDFYKYIAELQRHEDTLLNHRLQGFTVTTGLLLAAFAQLRDTIVAYALCLAGIALSAVMGWLLYRTAQAIKWYLVVLVRLDEALFPDTLQPYRTRRRMGKAIHACGCSAKVGVARILACIPWTFCVLWILLLLWRAAMA